MLLAGTSRTPSARKLPAILLGLTGLVGAGMVLLGVMPAIFLPAAVVSVVMGLAQGYVVIQFLTWLQSRTPAAMLGRTMSLLMFGMVGLAPLSSIVAGALIQLSALTLPCGLRRIHGPGGSHGRGPTVASRDDSSARQMGSAPPQNEW